MIDAKEREKLSNMVPRRTWVHTMDLGGGIVTKGQFGGGTPSPLILNAFDDIDFEGKKVLDIGCWDGLWTFEAEKRGADQVVAVDVVTHTKPGILPNFMVAQQLLESKATYRPGISVYDIGRLGISDFDIVLFLGVYYHLKNPLLALSKLRRVIKDGGLILVEGAAVYDNNGCSADFFYRDWYRQDASNWWIPTVRCLREWVECTFFEIVGEYVHDIVNVNPGQDPPVLSDEAAREEMFRTLAERGKRTNQRYLVTGRAVTRNDPNYGGYADDDLKEYGGWK